MCVGTVGRWSNVYYVRREAVGVATSYGDVKDGQCLNTLVRR